MLNKNKRGQVGETITWVVATLIIIVLLLISIYAATLLAKKNVIHYGEESRAQDVVMESSLFAYFWITEPVAKAKVLAGLLNMDEQGMFYGEFNLKFEELKGELDK